MAEFEIINDYPFEVCLLPREKALTFCDYLNSIGIGAQARAGAGAAWSVFVAKQEHVAKAKIELLSYANSPFDSKYTQASWRRGKATSNQKEIRAKYFSTIAWDPLSLTSIIEIICIVVFVAQCFNEDFVLDCLALYHTANGISPMEYYRLLTPVFLHFGIMHIAFNLVMWEAIARPIERTLGAKKLFSIFISVALLSNVLQFSFMGVNDVFGGLSGVVYGVIGYAGIMSKRPDLPQSMMVPKGLFAVSVIFVLLGFFIGGIANFCHLGGLILGALWGLFDLRRPLFKK